MRAVICREWGEIDELRVADVAPPVPRPGEVLIDVKATAVNYADAIMVAGNYQTRPPLPFSPGLETAGVVARCGQGVTRFRAGRSRDGHPRLRRARRAGRRAGARDVRHPRGHGLRRGRGVSHRLHLEPRGHPLAGPPRARRDAARARRGRRRRAHRGRDRQGHGRAGHRRRQHRREARPGPGARRRRGRRLRDGEADRSRDGADGGQGRRRVLRSRRRRAVRCRAVLPRLGRPHPPGRLRRRCAEDPRQPAPGEEPLRARLRPALLPLARAGQAAPDGRGAAPVVRGGQAQALRHRADAAREDASRRSVS